MRLHPAWLRRRPAALEMLFYLLIVIITTTVCARTIPVMRDKARLLEVLSLLSDARTGVVLDFAHDGYLKEPSADTSGERTVADATKGMQYLRQGSVLLARGTLYPANGNLSDTHPVAQSPHALPITLSMRPAIPEPASAWSVLWLCGEQTPPAGWTSPGKGMHSGLNQAHTPLACRNAMTKP